MKMAFLGRLDRKRVPASISVLDKFSFDEAQRIFLASWIGCDINLIASW
jgi:hypothetical protein